MALMESFSGIRGIYGKELTDDIAARYGYAFARFLRERKKGIKIVLGRDTRKSGDKLRLALIEGLDCDIIDAGILPTAAIENAVRHFKADAGIVITASHNEPNYNGFKFLDNDGAVLRPKDMDKVISNFHEIKELDEIDFLSKVLYKENKMEHIKKIEKLGNTSFAKYKKFIFSFINAQEIKSIKNAKIKIIIDPNGGAGILAKELFDELGINAVYVNMEKGIFKRRIEPTEAALKSLSKEIKKNNAQFAAGFDCDADRIEIIMEDGTLVSGNEILALITEEILSSIKNPEKEMVVVNDATSYVVKEIVSKYSARWKEVEVGEINVVDAMITFNSPVGGEGSNGGIIIPASRCRDGMLTLIYIFKILAKKKKQLKQLVNELPHYYYLKEKIKLKKDFADLREKIKKKYLDDEFLVEETGDETGGLKAIKGNAWVWFRQSKTEDRVLRIIADSKDRKKAEELLREAKRILNV